MEAKIHKKQSKNVQTSNKKKAMNKESNKVKNGTPIFVFGDHPRGVRGDPDGPFQEKKTIKNKTMEGNILTKFKKEMTKVKKDFEEFKSDIDITNQIVELQKEQISNEYDQEVKTSF